MKIEKYFILFLKMGRGYWMDLPGSISSDCSIALSKESIPYKSGKN